MNILKGKHVAILGLGLHGGGASALRFAHRNQPSHLTIIDKAFPQKQSLLLAPFQDIIADCTIGTYDSNTMAQYDIVIKNPAVPRTQDIITHCTHIETDISLYYQCQPTPTWMITGTKGKSSISTALYTLLQKSASSVELAGNITYSPLNLLLTKKSPKKLILELSSFQIGDLSLISDTHIRNTIFNQFEILILTNLFPDHQNYYTSISDYAQDKFLAFTHSSNTADMIVPYSEHTTINDDSISHSYLNQVLKIPTERGILHHIEYLPQPFRGAWIDEKGLWIRDTYEAKEYMLMPRAYLPTHIFPQNIAIVASTSISNKASSILSLPQTAHEWTDIFTVVHRKEYVAVIQERTFINDSAATIPQAMQLQIFSGHPIILIAGGTNKNIDVEVFIEAMKYAKTTILLSGSLTDLALPKLALTDYNYVGPFSSMDEACTVAFKESRPHDTIILSPGCASFELFAHEFERGDKFKQWVYNFQDLHT